MKVYRLLPSENGAILSPADPNLFDVVMNIDQSVVDRWIAPKLTIEFGQATDLAHMSSIFPVLRYDVVRLLEDLIDNAVIRLPVVVDGTKEYCGLYVSSVLDCLDEERSEVLYDEPGSALDIDKFVFDDDKLIGHHMFRLKISPYSEVFVSGVLADRLRHASLTGFELIELWSSE